MMAALKSKRMLLILTLGVFSIINTEMGVVGILPMLAEHYQVSITEAGLFVSLFALAVAISGPVMPLLFSGVNRKKLMVIVLGMFFVGNIVQAFTDSFQVALVARVVPAIFHPVYVSLALSLAAQTVEPKDVPRAVSRVMMGVSGGMVLGVPVVSFIASTVSLFAGMMVFVAVSGAVFLATCLFVPSIEVTERLTYGEQVGVLKRSTVWVSIVAVFFLNGAVFGVYSFFAEYLNAVTGIEPQMVSAILLAYGLANMVGNVIGGRALSESPVRTAVLFPILLMGVYACLFFTGNLSVLTAVVTLVWGVLAGAGSNVNQHLITSAAKEAPDFANGLFLATTNLGTTVGTSLCGALIAGMGTGSIVLGGMTFVASGFAAVLVRQWALGRANAQVKNSKRSVAATAGMDMKAGEAK